MPDHRHVRPVRWSSLRGSKGGGLLHQCHSRSCKTDRPFCRIREFPREVRTSREIGLDDRILSCGVPTVPLCPDRYTSGDTETVLSVDKHLSEIFLNTAS